MESDDLDFVLTAFCPLSAVSIVTSVERVLASVDRVAPIETFCAWRRHVARRRMFRSWLDVRSIEG